MNMRNEISSLEYEQALEQWTPKIEGLAHRAHVPFMEAEDLAQELALVLLKCLRSYDDSKGALFHTFFHSACWNRIFTLTRDSNRHRGYGTENNVTYLSGDPLEQLVLGDDISTSYNGRLVEAFSVEFEEPIELILELQGFEGPEVTYVRGRMDLLSIAETARAYEVPEGELRGVATRVRSKIAKMRAG